MAIILQESLRGLFYAPYYAALALGAYEKEGVEVRFVSARSPGEAPDALFDGTVDVAWGGPMRVNQFHDQRAHCDLVCIGEAVTRDPFMLIGRTPRPNFRLAVLTAVRLATVSEVPTPWLCLQEDLRRVGIDHVSDLGHVALLHQHLDDVDAALGHAVGEFLNRDGLRDRHFADKFFLRLIVAMAGHALRAPPERGDRTLAYFVGAQCSDQRQAAAAFFRCDGTYGLGRNRWSGNTARAPARPRRLVVIRFLYGNAARRSTCGYSMRSE